MGREWLKGSASYVLCRAILGGLGLFAPLVFGNQLSKNYNLELAPLVARNLPFDLWGSPGALSAAGIRASGKLADWDGAGEVTTFYQSAGADKAYTIEVAYRHEIYGDIFNGYFVIGYHMSKFDLTTDYDSDGNCIPDNCGNDSGLHYGPSYGGGLLVPVGENNPLKFGIRYYQRPQTWVLVEMSYGIRF
jgi:hypothetical protein